MKDTVKIVFQSVGVLTQTANNTVIVVNGEQHVGSEYIIPGTSNKTLIVPYGSIVTIPQTSGYNNRIFSLYSSNLIITTTTSCTFHAVFDVFINASTISSTASEE